MVLDQKFPRITLEAARVNAHLSQKDAARMLGINPATLANYESGKTIPQWDMVHKMEKVYGFPADFIILSRDSL